MQPGAGCTCTSVSRSLQLLGIPPCRQALQVRGSDVVALEASSSLEERRRLRLLPFAELDETGGLSELGAACRQAGLHQVFLTSMKLADR
jgi:hypothetical protein